MSITEGSVHSADGTCIGYHRLGIGPPLVFVHGSLATHTDWMPVAKLLSMRFTCYVMDRRGRGRSEMGASAYFIEREYEDIEAVMASAGPCAGLVSHSFGSVCAMGAALRTPVPRLVIYEPPLPVNGPIATEHIGQYTRAIAKSDLDLAIQIGLREFLRLPDNEIAEMRSSRAWTRLRTLAASWVRELEVIDSLSPNFDCYRALSSRSLMLRGSLSPEHPLQDSSRALAKALPGVRIKIMEGHDHLAMRTAPALVARLVGEFFES